MFTIRSILFLVSLTTLFDSLAITTIDFTIRLESPAIKYYRPFDYFANLVIPCDLKPDTKGKILVELDINKPTFVKFIIGGSVLWILAEPDDTIYIETMPMINSEPLSNIYITGNNSMGHEFYNKKYNYIPINKFTDLRSIFEKSKNEKADSIFKNIKVAINNEEKWVDSLYYLGQITKHYSDYMKIEIESVLAWEIGNLCDQYFNKSQEAILIASKIKKELFALVDPLSEKMYTCGLAFAYYYTYFEFIYNNHDVEIDTSNVIIEDIRFFALAPKELQKHLWGQHLSGYQEIAPIQYDYCKLFNKFKSIYKTGDYVDYFEKSEICNPRKPEFVKVLDTTDKDLFRLITENFYRKRVFIDLWATWCAPCKMEFAHYDSTFYEFMKEKKIDLVFLSIDKPELKNKWETEVKALSLKGYHALAAKTLQASIKEIVYDDGPIVIPRYILADENGRILSTDFKRPSDPSFRHEIEKAFPKR